MVSKKYSVPGNFDVDYALIFKTPAQIGKCRTITRQWRYFLSYLTMWTQRAPYWFEPLVSYISHCR